jgi:hypothetical protein
MVGRSPKVNDQMVATVPEIMHNSGNQTHPSVHLEKEVTAVLITVPHESTEDATGW